MRFLVIAALFGCVLAAPDRPSRPLPGYGSGGGAVLGGGSIILDDSDELSIGGSYAAPQLPSYSGGSSGSYGRPDPIACGPGQAPNGYGTCVDAVVTRNVFVYAAPYIPRQVGPPPRVPRPRIDYNVVVVRTPEQDSAETVVVPPPQQRTIVYVLTRQDTLEQQVIEIPGAAGQAPEVYYVTYRDGEDRQLKGGLSLQQVLRQAGQQGGVISGGGGGAGGVIIGGGAGGGGGGGGGAGGYGGSGGVVISGGGGGGGGSVSGGYGAPPSRPGYQ